VIATEPQPVRGKAHAYGQIAHELPKVRGPHPRVTAELIHLVRSGLDEQRRLACLRFTQRAFDHLRMRRAQRIDADALASLVSRHDV
jgi:hypothetical protein